MDMNESSGIQIPHLRPSNSALSNVKIFGNLFLRRSDPLRKFPRASMQVTRTRTSCIVLQVLFVGVCKIFLPVSSASRRRLKVQTVRIDFLVLIWGDQHEETSLYPLLHVEWYEWVGLFFVAVSDSKLSIMRISRILIPPYDLAIKLSLAEGSCPTSSVDNLEH